MEKPTKEQYLLADYQALKHPADMSYLHFEIYSIFQTPLSKMTVIYLMFIKLGSLGIRTLLNGPKVADYYY